MKHGKKMRLTRVIILHKKRWRKNILLCLILFVFVAAISFCYNYRRTMEVANQQKTEDELRQIEKENAAVKVTACPTAAVVTDSPKPEKAIKDTKPPKDTISTDRTEASETKDKVTAERIVVIDPGHQKTQNKEQEAIAPGASETKKKVTSGTQGRFTNIPEYEVNLEVGLSLRDALEEAGCTVVMTRETNEVDISNIERAKIANEANADVFIRLHCNGSENASVNGILTICPTSENPYCKSIYSDCYELSESVLASMIEATGAKDRGITLTDTMSGINWSKVPVTIVEMGYMTNEKEDELLVTKEYQDKLVKGLSEGILNYLDKKS